MLWNIFLVLFSIIWKCKSHSQLADYIKTGGRLDLAYGLLMPELKGSLANTTIYKI